jgi:ATP-dependent DNA helicase RecG
VGSDLFEESTTMHFPDLCKVMQIVRGPEEFLRPVNSGLLFFNSNPHRFFNRAWIELAIHKDETGRNYVSENFKGPLHKQIRNCLSYLQTEVLKTETRKITGKAENVSISNYPYNAIEEVISNAVYHKSYAEEKPIEIQVLPDRIEVLSYPGPLPPITNADLQQRRVIARDYRNRRIGDFLKELKLTEGKATGFPVIRDEMKRNGNPEPIFYTDESKTLFLVTLPCHTELKETKSETKSETKLTRKDIDEYFSKEFDFQDLSKLLENDLMDVVSYIRDLIETKSETKLIALIDLLSQHEKSRSELLEGIGLYNNTINFNKYIRPLIEIQVIKMTIPDKPNSWLQKYLLTEKGKKLIL